MQATQHNLDNVFGLNVSDNKLTWINHDDSEKQYYIINSGDMFLFRVDVVLLRKIGLFKSCSFRLKKVLESLKTNITEMQCKVL